MWSDFTFSSRKVHTTSAERLFLLYQTIILSFMRRCHIISCHISFKIKIKMKSSRVRVPWCSGVTVFFLRLCTIRQRVKYLRGRNSEDMRREEPKISPPRLAHPLNLPARVYSRVLSSLTRTRG